jgi:alpha-tubulin suppressor-like RCC1 family protein
VVALTPMPRLPLGSPTGLMLCVTAASLLVGCTQFAEVLTRRTQPQDERDAAASPQPTDDATTTEDTRSLTTSDATSTSVSNDDSTSGDTSHGETSAPEPEPLPVPALALGSGYNTTCLLVNTDSSRLACIGDHGLQRTRRREGNRGLDAFVAVAGGEKHMCVLSSRGHVSCWGDNSRGQLGSNGPQSSDELRSVNLPEPAHSLISGAAHTCVISHSQKLFCWGANDEGQLGLAKPDAGASTSETQPTPVLVDDGPWTSVGAGQAHTCGVKTDGSVWCWGRNAELQVAEVEEPRVNSPRRVNTDHSWSSVVAGQTHTCALRQDGSMWCWGSDTADNSGYPLGHDAGATLSTPTRLGDKRWKALFTRAFHSCALSNDDELACWGRNAEGQLGAGDTDLRRKPEVVLRGLTAVTLGLYHTCALLDNDIRCAGSNVYTQLGLPPGDRYVAFTSLLEEWLRFVETRSGQ